MANVLIKIEYDGSHFSGWQKQPKDRTVQGEIEHVLKYIALEDVPIHGTSRTDAGVHALGQCASFEWNCNMPVEKLPEVMNRRFGAGGAGRSGAPGDIRILSAEVMPEDFHARYSCKGKTYRYIIDRTGDIFRRYYAFMFPDAGSLNIDEMRKAAEHIVGTHDFKCFETSGGTPRETTVRTVSELTVNETDNEIIIEITGDGFLYNMVRIIVGTLCEVGLGKKSADELPGIIESKSRASAGFTAPPQGLYLKEIYFV
ncbi:MAG: tRNA pseudouridine(38-40) synthase TruA [Clostridiales bacterium]|nr:tRNA pseudouridine(38-40) synthase TruA [Candidatus Crickella caballi]